MKENVTNVMINRDCLDGFTSSLYALYGNEGKQKKGLMLFQLYCGNEEDFR